MYSTLILIQGTSKENDCTVKWDVFDWDMPFSSQSLWSQSTSEQSRVKMEKHTHIPYVTETNLCLCWVKLTSHCNRWCIFLFHHIAMSITMLSNRKKYISVWSDVGICACSLWDGTGDVGCLRNKQVKLASFLFTLSCLHGKEFVTFQKVKLDLIYEWEGFFHIALSTLVMLVIAVQHRHEHTRWISL